MKGRFITFEGMDGAGKSTQIERFNQWLQTRQINTKVVREPGGTIIGEAIRELLLSTPNLDAKTEVLLLFASRNELLKQSIRPMLNDGIWVVSDRFTDSTFAYQGGGRQLGDDFIQLLVDELHLDIKPDLTFYIDTHPMVSAKRSCETFESEGSDFYQRVQQRYYQLCQDFPSRIKKIHGFDENGQRSIESIQKEIQDMTEYQFFTD